MKNMKRKITSFARIERLITTMNCEVYNNINKNGVLAKSQRNILRLADVEQRNANFQRRGYTL
jgi:hypothetical protein